MAATPWLCNAFGVVYGGAIAFLADATVILAAGSTVDAGTAFNTMDLKVNFLRPVLVAMATSSVLVLPGRRWERPLQVADELA
ncbi:MAG: PaaI family thioesterase [Candidatus Dormibacteraeota bacterium]|nr:PaaI family thioesterase [Candidatus Dormibacteraeota bacterium]